MSTPTKEQVERGARALAELWHTNHIVPPILDKHSYRPTAEELMQQARASLEAALPVIRADVAREIAEWLETTAGKQHGTMWTGTRQTARMIRAEFGPFRDEEENEKEA